MHTTDIDENAEKAKKLQSVTQMGDFQEFFEYATLAEREFTAGVILCFQGLFKSRKAKCSVVFE
jgi:hypothetical protein